MSSRQEALARIKANSGHLVSVSDEILVYSRAEAGKLELYWEETDVAKIATDCRISEPALPEWGSGGRQLLIGNELDVIGYTLKEFSARARLGNAFVRRVLAEPKEWVRGGPEILVRTEAA